MCYHRSSRELSLKKRFMCQSVIGLEMIQQSCQYLILREASHNDAEKFRYLPLYIEQLNWEVA